MKFSAKALGSIPGTTKTKMFRGLLGYSKNKPGHLNLTII